jgi:acyl carrier protein
MDMSMDAIKAKVFQIVRDSVSSNFSAPAESGVDSSNLEHVNLIENLGMDSVQILSLLMTLEEEFGISLDEADVDLDKMMNVQSLVDFVVRKTAAVAQA